MALQDAEPAPWDSLPRDALVRVLRQLDSHVPSLCAAACVARAWRDAAAEPSLWARPQGLWWRAAERLTEERLEALVARARGGLERLDLRGARFIEDDGLEAALQQPHALDSLVEFVANTEGEPYGRSALGVTRALASRSGRTRLLDVKGLDCTSEFDDVRTEAAEVVAALRALLAPGGVLIGEHVCVGCSELCGAEDFCSTEGCPAVACEACREYIPFTWCGSCDALLCNGCIEGDFCDACQTEMDQMADEEQGDDDAHVAAE